jgi:hypothetical protein
MSAIDLKSVNSKLGAKGKRTHQNQAPIPKELRELSKSKARLEAKVSQLEREVKKQLGTKPAVAKAPAKPAAKPRIIETSAAEQARLEKLYLSQEERKKSGKTI